MRATGLFLLLIVGCNGGSSGSSGGTAGGSAGGGGGLLDKVKAAGDKVGGALDKLDADEVKEKTAAAKTSIGAGGDAAEECAWANRQAGDAPIDELRKLCALDAPMAKATVAVAKAEAAKTEQPQAPSYTECSSDDWAKAKVQIDAGKFATDPTWTELKARWSKVCGH